MVYKNSTEILNKLKTKGFQDSTISSYDFSMLYTTLPHNLIRNQLVDLIEQSFRREEALYWACNEESACFASEEHKNMIYGRVKKLQMHLFIFWTISILDLVLSFIDKM